MNTIQIPEEIELAPATGLFLGPSHVTAFRNNWAQMVKTYFVTRAPHCQVAGRVLWFVRGILCIAVTCHASHACKSYASPARFLPLVSHMLCKWYEYGFAGV